MYRDPESSYSTNRQRPFTFRMTATWLGRALVSPRCAIVFTITVPFGYRLPAFGLLA